MKRKTTLISSIALLLILGFTACENHANHPSGAESSTSVNSAPSQEIPSEETEAPSEISTLSPEVIENATITLSHTTGVYQEAFTLTLTASLPDADIYYTLDGSDPANSETALLYTEGISITDRKNDPNVLSAVNPVRFSGNYNRINPFKNGFLCNIDPPSEEAVDKCTVLRAVVKGADGSNGMEIFATYFIGTMEDHIKGIAESCAASGQSLAVISISIPFDDLMGDENGIYVKGSIFEEALKDYLTKNNLRDPEVARSLNANYKQKGRAWEREIALSFLECTPEGATEVLSQICGIRIQGNYSRSDLQKGFRLYARSDYGENNFDYAVFGNEYQNDAGEVMDKFKTLVLRAGGNCAFAAKINDTYWQQLLEDSACETQKSRPCILYLNGEYWGLYLLQEDYTDDYMEDLHGVKKDHVVIYKGDAEALSLGYKLDEGELPEGVDDESYYFQELLDFFKTHKDLCSTKDYVEFIQLVDPDSVRDYFAAQCWINNKWDWPGKNWSMWKTTEVDTNNPYADGRWRFLFYDLDFGGFSGAGEAQTNTIKDNNYKPNGLLDMDTSNPAVLCFAYLMTNVSFRNDFYARMEEMSATVFAKDHAHALLQQLEDTYAPLYAQFFERYEGTGSEDGARYGGAASIHAMREFITARPQHIQKMITWCEQVLKR